MKIVSSFSSLDLHPLEWNFRHYILVFRLIYFNPSKDEGELSPCVDSLSLGL